MKKIPVLIISSFIFFYCTPKNNSTIDEKTKQDSSITKEPSVEIASDTTSYKKFLDSLSPSEQSSLEGLEAFKNIISSRDLKRNDQLLKLYLKFQYALIGKLNEKMTSEDIENYSAVYFVDSTKNNDMAFSYYQNKLFKNGLKLSASEGNVYITSNMDMVTSYFIDEVSPSSKEYLTELSLEINQPYADDGGFSIPIKEVGQRLVFWDLFLSKYPDNIFTSEANQSYKAYLYAVMLGLDNTPAFSMVNGKLEKSFLETYTSISAKYPTSKTGKILSEYITLLAKNGYLYQGDVKTFAAEKNNLNYE